ncbi:MAG: O-antigen ligase family protein [Acidobacteria bacterium]|nr:O-antigen ligase family protein [Acidobacteriota bacterium]
MAIALAIVLALTPLAITPGWLFYFDVTGKAVILLLGAAMGLILLRGESALPGSGTGRWLVLLCVLQMISLSASTALSTNPALSLNGSNWRRFGGMTQAGLIAVVVLLAAWVAGNRARVLFLLRVISLSGLPIALYGVLQYFGWDPFLPASAYHVGEGMWTIVRPPATLGRANYFATYSLYVTFAGISLAMVESHPGWKLAGAASGLLPAIAIILSGTRSAMAGLAAGGVLLLVWSRQRFSRRLTLLGLAGIAALWIFYYSPPGLKLRSRTRWYLEDPHGGARLWLWRDSLLMARSRWLFGHGPETYATDFAKFQSAELSRVYPDTYHESPHNIYLDTLTSQGVPGLLILLALTALAFASAWKSRTVDNRLAGALLASFLAGLVSLQFIVFTLPTALLCYTTLALLVGQSVGPQTLRRAPSRRLRIAAALCALPLAAFAVQLAVTDAALAQVQRLLDGGRYRDAMRTYDFVRRSQPAGATSDVWYSRALLAASQKPSEPGLRLRMWLEAFEAATRAAQGAEDRHNACYNLAMFHAARNDAAETEHYLRAAAAWAPQWFKPHWTLAQLLLRTGRTAEARKEAELAVFLNGAKNPEVQKTLDGIKPVDSGKSSTYN